MAAMCSMMGLHAVVKSQSLITMNIPFIRSVSHLRHVKPLFLTFCTRIKANEHYYKFSTYLIGQNHRNLWFNSAKWPADAQCLPLNQYRKFSIVMGNFSTQQQPIPAPGIPQPGQEQQGSKSTPPNTDFQARVMKYTLLGFGLMLSAMSGFLVMSWGQEPMDETGVPVKDEYSDLPAWKAYLLRTWKEINYYDKLIKEPSRDKLLPDPLTEPYYQPPYTLVMEMTGILVHPDWTYKTGWRFKKRPAVDYFLQQIGPPLYEVVIYTSEQGFDLSCLNRDLSKVIFIDWNEKSFQMQPENALKLKKWQGNDEDRSLVDLAAFLRTVATSEVDDVRPVLSFYKQFDDPLAAFKANQQRLQDEQKRLAAAKGEYSDRSLSWTRRAILLVSVPATIMQSACRGLALKTTPKRSMSYLGAAICIISTAQQANPNVSGQTEPFRPQFSKSSTLATANSAALFVSNGLYRLRLTGRFGGPTGPCSTIYRIDELYKCKERLVKLRNQLDREIATLSMAKEQADRFVQDKDSALKITKHCLLMRDKRSNFEVVKDGVEDELAQEVNVCEGAKQLLTDKSKEAFEQLCLLQDIRNRVDKDLQDKRTTLAIDCDQLHLDNQALNKSFKLKANRLPEGIATYEQWLDNTNYLAMSAECEIQTSRRMREIIYNSILQSDNDSMSQKETTEFEFRKRMQQMRQAIDDHQWQKRNMEDEASNLERTILNLEDSYREKCNNMQLLETRLENRSYRPGMELCLDGAHKQLLGEWNRLKATMESLQKNISQTRTRLFELNETHRFTTDSLRDKLKALELDQRCMEERQKLPNISQKLDDTDILAHTIGIYRCMPETNWIEAATDPVITSGRWNITNPNLNQLRTAWELGRTDPMLLSSQLGPDDHFGRSGLYANAVP
uniref:FCP1 homology domain-containing protein n=1 Tax=Strigamia maritima TaxID=126957 RepID=T1JC09_STRMM